MYSVQEDEHAIIKIKDGGEVHTKKYIRYTRHSLVAAYPERRLEVRLLGSSTSICCWDEKERTIQNCVVFVAAAPAIFIRCLVLDVS